MAFASPLASLFANVAAVPVVNPILEDEELVLSEEELEVVGTKVWNQREDILARITKEERRYTVSNTQHNQRQVVHFKATTGRGRIRMAWTQFLYPLVRDEFERLRNAGVKFSPGVLRSVAKAVLCGANHPQFTPQTVMPDCPTPLIERINSRWIQSFQEHFNIVHRAQTGKLMVSQAKQEQIERSVAVHLGMLAGQFQSGQLDENLIENIDETHFVINMDNGKTLGFRGDNHVKYADVVSGGQGMIMVVKVTGGVHARIGTPFMIFANQDCNYPIGNVPDNVPGVAYRTTKKAFITSACLAEYYRERRCNRPDSQGRKITQWLDNAPEHTRTAAIDQALAEINYDVRSLPENVTHLIQPCDSFIISKIKDAWTRRWELKKVDLIKSNQWQGDRTRGTSGALKNPGQRYFLKLAADSVADVNSQRNEIDLSYARKVMIRCGLSLNVTGAWEERQLNPELQNIIQQYRTEFEASKQHHSVVAVPLVAPVIPVAEATPASPSFNTVPAASRIPRLARHANAQSSRFVPDSQV
ncbi:hypothetical protein R1sor_021524 [Riccia sorocarpa]|uniref:DDE-1 domain-containing protein n=1 Tax=Riccia sorocarpa TaxID=122646 RepID=A0ABD3GHB4_9MARC